MSNVDIDHVVQLVGYGTDAQLGDYFLIRNSWDVTWGEKGYIRLKRSSSAECGADPAPADGTGCSGGPASVKVCGQCGVLYGRIKLLNSDEVVGGKWGVEQVSTGMFSWD